MAESVLYGSVWRTPEGVANLNKYQAAKSRAWRRLARLHPEDFRRLLTEELDAAGWEPLVRGRPTELDRRRRRGEMS